MRPLSFENLRRLVGRKKDRNEPSFKRSESFKRISIRKSYLDRGKRRNRIQKNLDTAVNFPSQPAANEKILSQQIKEQEESKKNQESSLSRDFITYDEWLQGVRSASREKLHEINVESLQRVKVKVAKPANQTDSADSITEDLKILQLDSSPVLTPKPKLFRITDDETIEKHDTPSWTQESSMEGSPSVSISLGRIWRDAVPVPVPVSVSIPVSSSSFVSNSSHHFLDSALKEKKSQPTITRTVSAPEKPVSKDNTTSSSFGFSLKISKLADFRPGMTRNCLFRRKAPKLSPSISTEGYFKRTSTFRCSRRRGGKRNSQRASKKNQQPVIQSRTSSPVWFIPPERRRSRRQRRVWREIRYFPDEGPLLERINDWSSNVSDDQFDDQKLLLSGDFNIRREDDAFNSIVSSSLGSFSATSSSSSACPVPKISDFNEDKLFSEELRTNGLLARGTTWKLSATTIMTTATTTVATTIMSTATSTAASGNYFASSRFLNFLAEGIVKERSKGENSNTGYTCLSSTDSEDNNASRFNERRRNSKLPQQQQQQLKKSGPRRRPLRRKSELKRASGQPVFLVRKCSSLRKRPSKI